MVCSSFLRLLRETATAQLPKGGKKPSGKAAPTVEDPFAADAGSDDDVMDLDAAPSTTQAADALSSAQSEAELLPLCARNFAAILSAMSLKDQPDTARQVAEAFADVAAMTALPQSVTDASYAVLKALLAPVHGSTRELSAAVFRLLAPHLLGTAAASGPAAGKAARAKESRAAALEFVRAAVKEHPGCEEAAAALMRHLALHGPDKADGRSAAVECAVELCFMLGSGHLRNFVGFVARLSRTAKVPQRVMAVDLAHGLLESLGAEFGAFHVLSSRGIDSGAGGLLAAGGPHPLVPPAIAALRRASGPGRSGSERGTPAGRSTASGTGTLAGTPSTLVGTPASWTGIGPGGEPLTAAPWGVVCLAVLVQRGSDRAPAVRSRALSHLAAVVAAHAGDVPLEAEADMDVTGHTSSSRGSRASPTSVSFRAAVAAALQVNLQQPSPTEGPIPGLSPARGSPAGSDASGASPMAVDENTPSQAPGTANTSSALTSTGAKSSHRPSSAAPALPGAATFPVPCALIAAGDAADLMPLLRTARRRCRDEKGPARKGGVQLLQALILLRASGDCPALPSAQELAAFETAAADPLVTVRKAALVAVAALANVLPREADAGALWVAACLPLVRDPEASVLDTLLDQFQDMVLDKAATCAQGKEPGPAAVAAAAKLRPLLAAASQGGAAGKACLARACAQLKSKGRLQAKKAAAGLERIISGLGEFIFWCAGV